MTSGDVAKVRMLASSEQGRNPRPPALKHGVTTTPSFLLK